MRKEEKVSEGGRRRPPLLHPVLIWMKMTHTAESLFHSSRPRIRVTPSLTATLITPLKSATHPGSGRFLMWRMTLKINSTIRTELMRVIVVGYDSETCVYKKRFIRTESGCVQHSRGTKYAAFIVSSCVKCYISAEGTLPLGNGFFRFGLSRPQASKWKGKKVSVVLAE